MIIKVSVIMPSLNVAAYIDKAIKSVRDQTIREIEILCVDSGSTDGTSDIIKEHARQDDRVRLINSDVKSYGAQMNLGIRESRGKYIGIVETDDYVDPKMFETLFETAEKNECDFVKADYRAFVEDETGEEFYFKRKTFTDDRFYERIIYPEKCMEVITRDWFNWQGIYNRSFLRDNDISFSETPGAAFQDIGFLYQVIICSTRAMYLKDCFYFYRQDREESSSNSTRVLMYSYQEFRRLVNMSRSLNWKEDELRVLYCRMLKSAIGSLDFLLKWNEHFDGSVGEYEEWFRDQFKLALKQGFIKPEYFENWYWRDLQAFLVSSASLKKMLTDRHDRMKEMIGSSGIHRIAIFGCGNYGYDAYRDLNYLKYEIVGFIDNNEELWGKRCFGLKVMDPALVSGLDDDVKIVVANELYAEEIREQLIGTGIDGTRIVKYET